MTKYGKSVTTLSEMIIASKFLVPKGYIGISLYPFIFVKSEKYKENKIVINHESIHLCQQKELFVLPFYIIYFASYVLNLCLFFNHQKAYRNIIFEREAYENEKDLNYLKRRKKFAYWRKK